MWAGAPTAASQHQWQWGQHCSRRSVAATTPLQPHCVIGWGHVGEGGCVVRMVPVFGLTVYHASCVCVVGASFFLIRCGLNHWCGCCCWWFVGLSVFRSVSPFVVVFVKQSFGLLVYLPTCLSISCVVCLFVSLFAVCLSVCVFVLVSVPVPVLVLVPMHVFAPVVVLVPVPSAWAWLCHVPSVLLVRCRC